MANQLYLLTPELTAEISQELQIAAPQVEATLRLLLDDCTVPFIARYRKEATGALDEVQIRDIQEKFEYLHALNERKEAIVKSIDEQGKLTPELKQKILNCKVKADLEDLYLPFKPKKRTRGQIAKERGLEPLARQILAQPPDLEDLASLAMQYVGQHEEVKTLETALQGAKDFIAEYASELAEVRGEVRQWMLENSVFRSAVKDEFKDKKTKFNNYYDFSEPVAKIAAHRLMALRRGEKEEILKVTLEYDETIPTAMVERRIILSTATEPVKVYLMAACKDSFQRLIGPSIETELRLETKNRAEEEAIAVFAKNLRNLLLLPPIPKKIVLGVDPGIRTGSKLVVVDRTGKLLEYTTIYPDYESEAFSNKNQTAAQKVADLITKYQVECISIGNGTAGREMEDFIEKVVAKMPDKKLKILIVNEAGASVYSASDVAREEFPDLDLTFRGAVSIARRLQDPLAELVKIDPKSIGVGQYQHDVNQSRLKRSLESVVESCVNYVGVNLNTASPSLLSYVAGIGPTLAKNIVRHREQNGEFKDRNALFQVMGFGPKAFEQAAGFLRIPESSIALDNTAVHPEAYGVVETIAKDLSVSLDELLGNREKLAHVNLEKYATQNIGLLTLKDILTELKKPGRDPREEGAKQSYNREIRDFAHLQEGQIVSGTVTNVTNFGAFVDIGVHQDGLVHISELSNQFIKDPAQAVSVGDQIKVKIIGLDKERKRISLSKRAAETDAPGANSMRQPITNKAHSKTNVEARPGTLSNRSGASAHSVQVGKQEKVSATRSENRASRPKSNEPAKQHSLEDLLAKFNSHKA